MRLTDARYEILTKLYRDSPRPDEFRDESGLLATLFCGDDQVIAGIVLRDLIAKGFVTKAEGEIALTVDGCYETERLSTERLPSRDHTPHYIALYSIVVASFLTLLFAIPSGIQAYIITACSSGGGAVGEPWCDEVFGFYWWDSGLYNILTSHIVWAAVLGTVSVFVIYFITRRWKRTS